MTPGGVCVWSFAIAGLDGDPSHLGLMEIMAQSNDGYLHHNIRYPNGSWQGWAKPVQPPIGFKYSSGPNILAAADYNGNYCDPHIAANPVEQYGDAHVDETCTDAPNALTG